MILVLKYSFADKTQTFPIISGVRMTVGSPDDSEGMHFSQATKHTVEQPVTHAALVRRRLCRRRVATNCAPRTTVIVRGKPRPE